MLQRVSKKIFREVMSYNMPDRFSGEKLSLINANIPIGESRKMTKEEFVKSGMQSFGLFGGSGNVNGNTPNVSLEDVMPKPEDFVNFPFRFISETIVGGGSWKASDFRLPGVLQESMSKLEGKTIFTDHTQDSENWAGLVRNTHWQPAFTAEDGTFIPAGINGDASIDSKTNYRLVRGIASGAVKSNSVTTAFDWEPSHKFSTTQEFMESIGSTGKDGHMVTRKVLDILDYFESSMLWLGADPFSKKLDSKGQPIHVDKTSVYFSKASEGEKEVYENEKLFVVDAGCDKEILSLSKSGQKINLNDNKKDKNMKPFLLAFIAAFGTSLNLSFTTVEGDDLTPEQEAEATAALAKLDIKSTEAPAELSADEKKLLEFTKKVKTFNDKGELVDFTAANAEKGNLVVLDKAAKDLLDTQITQLTKEVGELKPQATIGTEFLKMKREETLRLAKVASKDGTISAAIEKNINEASAELLDGMLVQYGADVQMKFQPTCKTCGNSDSIEMRSSFDTSDAGSGNNETVSTPVLGADALREKYSNTSLFGLTK